MSGEKDLRVWDCGVQGTQTAPDLTHNKPSLTNPMEASMIARLTAAAAGAALLLAAGSAFAAKAPAKCVVAGGEATMVTEDLARFMAGAALKNSIEGMGAKPQGAITTKCTSTGLTYCISKQNACK
jgi:hypothetical protein